MTVENKGTAQLSYDGKTYDLDVIQGSEGEKGVQIGSLRKESGMITIDPGFVNTGSCLSSLTFINGEEGILRYKGHPIDVLADKCKFTEVSYLLVHGELPNKSQLDHFREQLQSVIMLHEGMSNFLKFYPRNAHPMAILSSMVMSLSSFYPEIEGQDKDIDLTVARLLSKLRTLAAFSYKHSIGEPIVYPKRHYNFVENFLYMMFATPMEEYSPDPVHVSALNKLLILHADHEQNCSTSVVRMVGSSGANLYASIAAGIGALWGPLHGGANQAVLEMLEDIRSRGLTVDQVVEKCKNKDADFRLMGFGHRVYKSYDPRARIAKECCKDVLAKLGKSDELLDIAMELEERALNDDYFVSRNLYPNVDYYTGLTYRAMGFPTNMFTVLFSIGRLPGWIAHYAEQAEDPSSRIGRPRQIYTGPTEQPFVPIADRP
jgi:citrate synthase